jgi:rhodanese-related sulfurtransferase
MVLLMALVLVFAGACGGGGDTTTPPATPTGLPGTEVQVSGGSYWVVTAAQLYNLLQDNDIFLVNLDVVRQNIIEGTDFYVVPAEIQQNLNSFPAAKNSKIVLYCMFGGSFSPVATALVATGYTQVMALEGGIAKWANQGYPVKQYTAP